MTKRDIFEWSCVALMFGGLLGAMFGVPYADWTFAGATAIGFTSVKLIPRKAA